MGQPVRKARSFFGALICIVGTGIIQMSAQTITTDSTSPGMESLRFSTITNRSYMPKDSVNISDLKAFIRWKESRQQTYSLLPTNNSNPVSVKVDLKIINLEDIDSANAEFKADVYFLQVWQDNRLIFGEDLPWIESVGIPDAYYEDIWLPDVYIEDIKRGYTHNITMSNRMFRIFPNGTIAYSKRLQMVVWCVLDLKRFPLDKQTCVIHLLSFRYTTSEVQLEWLFDSILPPDNKMDSYSLENLILDNCSRTFVTGEFPCVCVTLVFVRLFGYYCIEVYVPSILIVSLSWVSFWLHPTAVAGRVSLGIVTILAITKQMSSLNPQAIPKVSYVTSLDVWLITCVTFLCASALEFAVVDTIGRRAPKVRINRSQNLHVCSDNNSDTPEICDTCARSKTHEDDSVVCTCQLGNPGITDQAINGDHTKRGSIIPVDDPMQQAIRVDKASRIMFPILFFCFNVVYWAVYS